MGIWKVNIVLSQAPSMLVFGLLAETWKSASYKSLLWSYKDLSV